jgi:uncharacterized protein (TIGR03437 family)
VNIIRTLGRTQALLFALAAFALTAHAQTSNPLVVSPSALNFNSSGPFSQAVTVSSSTGAAIPFTTTLAGSWITVNPATGTTPQAVTVTVNPAGLTGTNVGFVNFTSGTNTVPVQVTFNATGSTGGASALSATPSSLTFNFQPGSTTAVTQQLQVATSSPQVTSFTASTVTSNNGNWISVNPSSATVSPTTPATLNVAVTPTGLTAGTYNAVIALNPPGTTGITVPVLVNVATPSALNVTPTQLNFAFQSGTTPGPPAQTLTVTSVSGSQVSFTADPTTTSCGSNWLVVNPRTSATPASITVQINTSGLQPGTCAGQIVITAPGTATPTQTIPVNLLVSTNPLLQVPTVGPTFNFQLGSNTAIPAQNVQITSSGAPIAFTVTATPVTGGVNFLTVTPTSGTTPQAIALSVNPTVLSGLAPGTYTENVTVTSPGAGNSPQTFPVTLVVGNNPVLIPSQPSVTFNYQIGQTPPSSQIVTLASSGTPLNYVVTTTSTNCGAFLSASPVSGITQGVQGSQGQLIISVNTQGITAPASCTGTVTVTVPGSTAPPLVIPVTLNASTSPLLNASVSAISVTALAGSTAITQQIISLTSTDFVTPLNFTAVAATNPAGLTWLSVAPNTGTTPSNLNVIVNPVNLPVGVYTGTITVSSTSPNVPTQNIPVTLKVVSAFITATPTSLAFSQALGGPAPANQTIEVTGLPAGTTIGASATMFTGTGWLTVTPNPTAGTVTVSANAGQLSQGVYQGLVTIIAPGANPSPLYVPVTLTVGSPQTLVLAAQSVSFSFQAGAATLPASQTIQLTSIGGNVPFTTSFTPATGGAFVTVSPASGTTPGPITIALNQTVVRQLGPGTYTGTIAVSSPNIPNGTQLINVSLTIAPQGPPSVTAIANAASNTPGAVAPGEIISIYGTGIGPNTPAVFQLNAQNLVPTTLSGVRVTFDGTAAPLLFVSSTQINAIVPYEMAGRTTTSVIVQGPGGSSSPISLRVADTAPAIFSLGQNGTGQGAILNQNASVNGPANPAAKGSIISIYATGEGVVPGAATGSVTTTTGPNFPKPAATISVTIAGVQAQILYAGEAPGLVSGVLQVNAMVPAGVASGNLPVVLTAGPNSSLPNITVAVQ